MSLPGVLHKIVPPLLLLSKDLNILDANASATDLLGGESLQGRTLESIIEGKIPPVGTPRLVRLKLGNCCILCTLQIEPGDAMRCYISPLTNFVPGAVAPNRPSRVLRVDSLRVLPGDRIIMRVDFNVVVDPKTGKLTNDLRLREVLPTISYLVTRLARIVLVSHRGRPNGKYDPSLSLKPVYYRLVELLKDITPHVAFVPQLSEAEATMHKLKRGGVMLLENIRFEPGEESDDLSKQQALVRSLAKLADVFVCDAFGTTHRVSPSMTGLPTYMCGGVSGFLLASEISALDKVLTSFKPPVVCVVGGSKVSDKIGLLRNMMTFADTLLLGGAMAYVFLAAKGYQLGKSKVEKGEDLCDIALDLLALAEKSNVKLLLPVDHLCAATLSPDVEAVAISSANVPEDLMALDIGPKTAKLFANEIAKGRTVVWNGPVGMFELKAFRKGSETVGLAMAKNKKAFTVVGGGETIIVAAPFADRISHVSTGGGAMLSFLEGGVLPGIAPLTFQAPLQSMPFQSKL